jgi:hypothetical protein
MLLLLASCRWAALLGAPLAVVGSALLLLEPASVRAQSAPDELLSLCQLDSLPADIRGSLQRNFSAWKIQEPTDLSAAARAKWLGERPLTCPGIGAGHFQSPRDASYALLLVAADHSSPIFRVLVFTQQSGQKFYGFKVVQQAESGASDFFLRSVPTSRYTEEQSRWSFRARPTDSLLLVYCADKAQEADLYVWSNDAFQRVQVPY